MWKILNIFRVKRLPSPAILEECCLVSALFPSFFLQARLLICVFSFPREPGCCVTDTSTSCSPKKCGCAREVGSFVFRPWLQKDREWKGLKTVAECPTLPLTQEMNIKKTMPVFHSVLYTIPTGAHKENLFNNEKPLKLVIVSFILRTLMFDSEW